MESLGGVAGLAVAPARVAGKFVEVVAMDPAGGIGLLRIPEKLTTSARPTTHAMTGAASDLLDLVRVDLDPPRLLLLL